jgi:LysM repeat protein
MKVYLLLSAILTTAFTSFSQTAIDTIETSAGKMIVFSNRTWKYLEDQEFDGILNDHLHDMVSGNEQLNFVQTWDNEVCYTSDRANNMNNLSDTLWLCLMDDAHGSFVIPAPGVVTSRYGYRSGRYHNGIDIDLNIGDTVRAAWSGKVRYAKYNDGGFGNLVIVRHYNGLETFYAHLSKHLVAPDQEVKAGEPLGLGGNTGRSFGPHLHFEVRFYDAPMNPEQVIDFAKKECKDENLFVHKSLFRPGAKPTDQEEHGESIASVQTTKAKATANGSRKYYKVRPGDTLSEIASRNNTTVSRICGLNGIKPSKTLQIGQSIRVR